MNKRDKEYFAYILFAIMAILILLAIVLHDENKTSGLHWADPKAEKPPISQGLPAGARDNYLAVARQGVKDRSAGVNIGGNAAAAIKGDI